MPQRVQTLRTSTKLQRPTAGSREPGELYVSFPDLQLGVINVGKAAQDLLAIRFFSSATDYVAGDFVINAGVGYKAKGAITAGAFNAANWDTIATSGNFEPPVASGTTSQYWRGDKSWQTLDKTAVGLANVDNTSDANKPISSATQAQLNLKAPLASPTFTGTVIAPTQATGTSNTTVATTEFVARDFAPIMSPTFGGDPRAPTPATADNDTSVATTAYVKANLVSYAPINSPVFTGIPVAPTPSPGDNDTSIATTEFVQTAIGTRPTDAPSDGNWYGRRNGGWADVTEEAPADGVSYGRKNGAWVASVGGAVISDGPPPGPLTPGQLWWEADSGNTYLWYDDGSSQQWMQQNIAAPVTEMPSGLTAETRNRVVNPAMQISQEFADAGTTTAFTYPVDQWFLGHQGMAGTTSASRTLGTLSPNGNATLVTWLAVAEPSPAGTDVWYIRQTIEGTRIRDFQWGTASAKQAVLRFWVYITQAGTYAVSIQNGANRSFLATYTVAASTWTEVKIVIPGDTTGTWLTTTGVGLYLNFQLVNGSTWIGGAPGWNAGSFNAPPGCTNNASTAFTAYFADVGLYLDPLNSGVPPRWQMPDEAEELRACKRYWERVGYGSAWSGNVTSGFTYTSMGQWEVAKRVASPSLTGTHLGSSGFPATVGPLTAPDYIKFYKSRVSNSALSGGNFFSTITGNARM